MRTNVLLFLPAAACTLLAACNRNDANTRPPELSGEAIRFEMSIPTTRTVTGADFKTEWSTGDRIGLYAVPAGEPLQSTDNPFHNVALTYDGRLWSGEETVFWPDDHASLDFYAYYPYDEAADDPAAIAFAVRLDQSATTEGKSHYGLSDLMTARSEGATKGKTVALSFAHALSMVQVSVAAGPYKSMGADESLTVTLAGVRPHAVLNLAGTTPTVTLAETDNTPTTVTMHFVEQPQDAPRTAYMFRALLPAQTLDVQFSFEHDNRLFFRDTDPESAVETVAGQVEAFKRRLPDNLYQTVLCKAATFRMGANDRNLWEDKIHADLRLPHHPVRNHQHPVRRIPERRRRGSGRHAAFGTLSGPNTGNSPHVGSELDRRRRVATGRRICRLSSYQRIVVRCRRIRPLGRRSTPDRRPMGIRLPCRLEPQLSAR